MSIVYLMVGPAGSGKSYFASKMVNGLTPEQYRVISTDELRELYGESASDQSVSRLVFAIAQEILVESISNKIPIIIIDAMNLNRKSRKKFTTLAHDHGATVVAVIMSTPVEVALERNANRDRRVPVNVVLDQYRRFRPPEEWEGEVDYVFTIEASEAGNYRTADLVRRGLPLQS